MKSGWNKYGAKKFELDGIKFDSKAEANAYYHLKLMERGNLINIIEIHSPVSMTLANIKCKIDFKVKDLHTAEIYYIEVKGRSARDWIVKKNLWRVYGPARLEIWDINLNITSVITPKVPIKKT